MQRVSRGSLTVTMAGVLIHGCVAMDEMTAETTAMKLTAVRVINH